LSWQDILRPWQQTGRDRFLRPLLFYQDTGDFLTITDQLSENSFKTVLKGVERELYLFCDSIQTRSAILKQFPELSPDHLEGILEKWIANRWMFREEEKLLSLAIRMSSMISAISYLSNYYYKDLMKKWGPPPPSPPYWKKCLKIGSIADINLSINFNKIPTWLRRLKKKMTFK
jgi:hypothetical protein